MLRTPSRLHARISWKILKRFCLVEGYVHANREIGGCSLNQWLPISHIHELQAINFEPVYPGHGQSSDDTESMPQFGNFLTRRHSNRLQMASRSVSIISARVPNQNVLILRSPAHGSCTPGFALLATGMFRVSWTIKRFVGRHTSRRLR